MPVSPLDTLLAIKIINLMEGLKPSDRRVASTLIEHYNRKTGRCDPSVGRLAKLLGLSTRTIIRATNNLERLGLFKKARHGGHSHCNLYQPNWDRFAALEVAWRERLRASSRRTKLSHLGGQEGHLATDSAVNQTCTFNLNQETYPSRRESKNAVRRALASDPARFVVCVNSNEAAAVAAERRWTGSLHRLFSGTPVTYGEIIEAIDPAMREAATLAEMNHRDAGLNHILRTLKMAGTKC